jgi:hypothetical protein
MDKTMMAFGDAKKVIEDMVKCWVKWIIPIRQRFQIAKHLKSQFLSFQYMQN